LGTAHARQGQKMGGKAIFGLKMVLKRAGAALLGKNTDFWARGTGLHVPRRRNYTHIYIYVYIYICISTQANRATSPLIILRH
jgi:hypothetical protein